MPTDQLKEAHAPQFEDNTSYRDPLKELEELEEWCNSKKIDLPEWVDVSNGIPVSIVEAFRVKDQGYNKALEEVLAKIAEMREVDI